MATYSSSEVPLQAPAETVFAKLSNLENLRSLLDKVPADQIPADQRKMLEDIKVSQDSITVPGGPVGSLTFKVVERREPSLVKLDGIGSPVPLSLSLHISPEGAVCSRAKVEVDISIPAIMKPMVSGPIKQICDQFSQVLKAIPFS